MHAYRTPGVYFERLDTRSPEITPLRTDIAGFVGIAERGPLHTPVKIDSWTQYTSVFGQHTSLGYLAFAVDGFFSNGGAECWVVRVADPDAARKARLVIRDADERPIVVLEASSEGSWASKLQIVALPAGGDRFTIVLRLPSGQQELFSNLTENVSSTRNVTQVLNDTESGSRLVSALTPTSATTSLAASATVGGGSGWMRGGRDGLESLHPRHLSGDGAPLDGQWGLAALEPINEISIVAIPDIFPTPADSSPGPSLKPEPRCDTVPDESPLEDLFGQMNESPVLPDPPESSRSFNPGHARMLQRALINHSERLHDRVAILDSYPADITVSQVTGRRNLFDSSFASFYFPWIRVKEPLLPGEVVREVPPCGHIAGIYARGDRTIGVHKPPANQVVEGARDVAMDVDDADHGDLNDQSVNVIRLCPGRGVRVMGARSLVRGNDHTWRYINVRRLLLMIEEAIETRTQWAVFEPHNIKLRRDMDRSVRSFLGSLWRRGMLDGATADDAYTVICDESTNPSGNVELGRLTCLVGVQPPYPAEFVIVRVGKTQDGTDFLEARGLNGV